MKKKIYILFVLVLFVFSCGTEGSSSEESALKNSQQTSKFSENNQNPNQIDNEIDADLEKYDIKDDSKYLNKNLLSWVDSLRMRKYPDLKSETLKVLKQGEELISLDRSTNEKLKIKLRGIDIEDCWEFVKTEDGVEGWVFGGALTTYQMSSGYKIYGCENELFIKDNQTGKIITLYQVFDNKEKKYYINDVSYEYVEDVMVIRIDRKNYYDPVDLAIFDTSKNEFYGVVQIYECVSILGLSPDGKYLAFDSGTGADYRDIIIFSFEKREIVFNETVLNSLQGKWKSEGLFVIYKNLGKEVEGKPILDGLKVYAEEFIWKDGVLKSTGNIIETRTES